MIFLFSFEVTPTAGTKRARLPPQPSAAVVAFWGNRDPQGRGGQKASLTASGGG